MAVPEDMSDAEDLQGLSAVDSPVLGEELPAISELRQKNAELKKSEERYHKMIEEVEDYAILLLDPNGIVQNWNKGAEKIKGYREEEIVGQHFRLFYLQEDRENKLPEKLIEQAVLNGKAVHEGWRQRKDGSHFWGSIVITALHDEHGKILGFSKVTRDLTDIKAANDRILDNARELEFQNKELQQFTYAAAHDLKEPLRKLQFYNTSLLENYSADLPEKGKEYLNKAIGSVVRMRSLIDDLLRYSETTSVAAEFEWIDVVRILEEVKFSYEDAIGAGIIDLGLCDSAEILAIPFQIRQLFDNLIGNAIKYRSPDRPLRVAISCKKVYDQGGKRTTPSQENCRLKLMIADNGIGFPPQSAQVIFELFQRLHSRNEYSGTGVGLAICKKIVQNHNGLIEASGEPSIGATFTIYLPCR